MNSNEQPTIWISVETQERHALQNAGFSDADYAA